MNERQAVKFWNSIAQGELFQVIPDSEFSQGGEFFKDTYSSTICDQFDLPVLSVPRPDYNYLGEHVGTVRTNASDAEKVANFLRNLANSIEQSSKVTL